MKEVWCVLHSKIELFNDDGSTPTERAMPVDPVRCLTHGSRIPCPWCPDGRFPARIADLGLTPPTQEELEQTGREILSELPSQPGRGRNRIIETLIREAQRRGMHVASIDNPLVCGTCRHMMEVHESGMSGEDETICIDCQWDREHSRVVHVRQHYRRIPGRGRVLVGPTNGFTRR